MPPQSTLHDHLLQSIQDYCDTFHSLSTTVQVEGTVCVVIDESHVFIAALNLKYAKEQNAVMGNNLNGHTSDFTGPCTVVKTSKLCDQTPENSPFPKGSGLVKQEQNSLKTELNWTTSEKSSHSPYSATTASDSFLQKGSSSYPLGAVNEKQFRELISTAQNTDEIVDKFILEPNATGNFPCYFCGKQYSFKYSLKQHITLKHGGKLKDFKCKFCDQIFRYNSSLLSHMKKKHYNSLTADFECPMCKERCINEPALKQHFTRKHADSSYVGPCSSTIIRSKENSEKYDFSPNQLYGHLSVLSRDALDSQPGTADESDDDPTGSDVLTEHDQASPSPERPSSDDFLHPHMDSAVFPNPILHAALTKNLMQTKSARRKGKPSQFLRQVAQVMGNVNTEVFDGAPSHFAPDPLSFNNAAENSSGQLDFKDESAGVTPGENPLKRPKFEEDATWSANSPQAPVVDGFPSESSSDILPESEQALVIVDPATSEEFAKSQSEPAVLLNAATPKNSRQTKTSRRKGKPSQFLGQVGQVQDEATTDVFQGLSLPFAADIFSLKHAAASMTGMDGQSYSETTVENMLKIPQLEDYQAASTSTPRTSALDSSLLKSPGTKVSLTEHFTKERCDDGRMHYFCNYCQKSFVDRSNLSQHLDSHIGLQSHACQVCGECFTYRASLHNHMKSKHASAEQKQAQLQLGCKKCDRKFKFPSELKRHLENFPAHNLDN